MEKDLNTVLSTLLNTFELINIALKNNADSCLLNYTITEIHCIEHIGKIKNANVTKISQMLHITRGGISKLIKKLILKGAITTYSSDLNKKEIYYKLTPIGKQVFDAHEQIHQKWNHKDSEFFKQFNEDEIKFVMNFIQKYTEYLKSTIKEEIKC